MRFQPGGCTLACRFCHTGTQKLVRNLTAAEITGQLVAARDALEDWQTGNTRIAARKITNIVLMGMGEPLYNTDNVIAALNVMSDGDGLACRADASHCRHRVLCQTLPGWGQKPASCWQYPSTPCAMICVMNWCR